MQRVTPRPSIPSSGRGRPARGLAGLGAIAGPRALPPGSPRSPSFPAPAPPRYKARSTVRTMVAEAGFVRGGQCGTRGGPPLRHGGPRRESFGLRGRVVPHGCSRDPPACEERSNAKRLVPIRRDGGTGRRDGLKIPRGDQVEHHVPPGAQGMERSRSARPATTGMSATPPLALAPSASRAFETDLPQALYFGVSSALDARAWRNGRRSGLEEHLSARWETGDAELPKLGEPCHMVIPSQARPDPFRREGVETRRAAPNLGRHPGHGEGIVQTANLAGILKRGRRKP